jgi:hypothetical protein
MRIKPTTSLDKAALIHDIEYLRGDQFKADNNMWLNLVRDNPLDFPLANYARAAFLVKDIVGYQTDIDIDSYNMLKNIVKNEYDLGKMDFYD